ncbi:hypothetical protein [Borreliella valaisiana]|uniref:Uncharacterized protein n=1 Tax=Borreliella valaisiana VS116 TaxID=445987 RepID=C0R8K3_BORVA|nr:hypothetical protein [Borreliella valaisiana]ACN52799.1 hypothetical protein BVAVS116_K0010 [Borreliella valaisiana VS116]
MLNTANSYLENARKAPKSNQDNQTLLLSLHQAIAKVKSSHASFIICYNDAFNSLGIADTAFKDARERQLRYKMLKRKITNGITVIIILYK